MSKILPFVRLDMYTLKPYKKSLLFLVALGIGMTVLLKSATTLSFYLMMSLVLVMAYPFSIGETHRLDTLYAALPLRRRDIVTGRYAFAFCMELAVILLILILSLLLSVFTDLEFAAQEVLLYLSIASLIFTVAVSVQYPVYFKLGYNKAKFMAYVPMIVIFLAVMLAQNVLKDVNIGISFEEFLQIVLSHPFLPYAVPVAAGHLLLAVSCRISQRLYEKRDF